MREKRQIGQYIADFYSRQARLVVEVDGALAHSSEHALADLNAALKGHLLKLKVAQGGRAGQIVDDRGIESLKVMELE